MDGLTKDDLKALRHATEAVVRVEQAGTSFELLKRMYGKSDKDGFSGRDETLRYSIGCETNSRAYGTAMIYNHEGAFQVLQRFCREGDILSFRLRENGNGYSKAAVVLEERLDKSDDGRRYHIGGYQHLHIDELVVTIRRSGKDLIRDLVLDSTPCVDNSARTIREGGQSSW